MGLVWADATNWPILIAWVCAGVLHRGLAGGHWSPRRISGRGPSHGNGSDSRESKAGIHDALKADHAPGGARPPCGKGLSFYITPSRPSSSTSTSSHPILSRYRSVISTSQMAAQLSYQQGATTTRTCLMPPGSKSTDQQMDTMMMHRSSRMCTGLCT